MRMQICAHCQAKNIDSLTACWQCHRPLQADPEDTNTTLERSSLESSSATIGSGTSTMRRWGGHLGLMIAVVLALGAIVVAVVYLLGKGMPDHAAGFTLLEARSLDAGLLLGPPVLQSNEVKVVPHHVAAYAQHDGLVEVQVMEIDLTDFTIDALLEAQLIDRRTDRWATTRIDGVAYTCGGNGVARWCFWATSSHFGRTNTAEPGQGEPDTSIASLRRLAVAINDAFS